MSDDPYVVLGVPVDASDEQVRRAYLALARTHHPDQHASAPADERAGHEREMRRINSAWQVLGDPDRRRAHDAIRAESGPSVIRSSGERQPFVPFDDGDDEVHPELLDDAGVEGTGVGSGLQVGPVVFVLGGVFGIVVGVLVQLPFLVGVGAVGLIGGSLTFLAAPAVAIARSRSAERNP